MFYDREPMFTVKFHYFLIDLLIYSIQVLPNIEIFITEVDGYTFVIYQTVLLLTN
jgi:hypothetical protein